MGVNKQFITNITSSAKKRFLKSLKTPAMQWTSVAYSIVFESVSHNNITRKLPDE